MYFWIKIKLQFYKRNTQRPFSKTQESAKLKFKLVSDFCILTHFSFPRKIMNSLKNDLIGHYGTGMKVGWALRESKQGPLTASRLETHFPQYWFGLYSPRKLSNFNRYPYWVWGEIDKENNIADNHKWIEFEHNWDELQCLKIELFQKWA